MSDSDTSSADTCSSSCSSTPPQTLRLYQIVIFATPVLFAIILILLFIMFYLRRRRIRRINSQIRVQFFAETLFSPPSEHGLSKSFRQGLPIFPYDEHYAASREDTQCAVCLGDYQLGEKIQQLPGCVHAFHAECIDEWLVNNYTCPICRTCLLPEGKGLTVDSFNSLSGSNGDSSRGIESRRWEERILSEIQENNIMRTSEGFRGNSSNRLPSLPDANIGVSIEHAINIERS